MTRKLEVVLIAGCVFLAAIEGPRALEVLRGGVFPETLALEEHVVLEVALPAPIVAVLNVAPSIGAEEDGPALLDGNDG